MGVGDRTVVEEIGQPADVALFQLRQGVAHGADAVGVVCLAPDGDPSKGIEGWRLDVPGDIPHPF